jgi:hypothetical protein
MPEYLGWQNGLLLGRELKKLAWKIKTTEAQHAAEQGIAEEEMPGVEFRSKEFQEKGAELYSKA